MTPIHSWTIAIAVMVIIAVMWRGARSRGRCWDIKVRDRGPIPYDKPEIIPGLIDNALLAGLLKETGWHGGFWKKKEVE
jgi:hypothetical protein